MWPHVKKYITSRERQAASDRGTQSHGSFFEMMQGEPGCRRRFLTAGVLPNGKEGCTGLILRSCRPRTLEETEEVKHVLSNS